MNARLIECRFPSDPLPHPIPPLDRLRALVLEPDPKWWATGMGALELVYEPVAMIIKRNEALGFLVIFQELGFGAPIIGDVAVNLSNRSQASAAPWGETTRYPAKCFVDGDTTWTAIAEFIRTGKKSTSVTWVSGDELQLDV